MTTKLLTIEEVAQRLNKTAAALRSMRYEGKGPRAAKIGGRLMYREADVEAYIDAAFTELSA